MSKSYPAEFQDKVAQELVKSRKVAERELLKMRTHVAGKLKEVERFIEKNPEKAALISAGVGAALGAALALVMKTGSKKKR